MKLLRLLPLLLLPVLFLGATCVTHVDQKGPSGPWLGEVVNSGDTLQPDVHVFGFVYDSSRKWMDTAYAQTCPFDLLPGQVGYFIRGAESPASLPKGVGATLPLQVDSLQSYTCQAHSLTTDVNLRIVSMSDDHKSALVEARNDSQNTYYDLGVCGVSFTPAGEAEDVATNPELPSRILRPSDKVQFSLNFNAPVTGHVDLAVKSAFGTYDTVLDSSHFEVTSSKVVQTNSGPQLQVVGEVRNDLPVDLVNAQFEAYLESTPSTRVSGWIGPFDYAGWGPNEGQVMGDGFIPADGRAPFAFSIPLPPNERGSPSVRFAGVVASRSNDTEVPLLVTDVSSQQSAPGSLIITATVRNPSASTLYLDSMCFEARGAAGELVGVSCRSSCGVDVHNPYTLSESVTTLGPIESVDVVAFGRTDSCHVTPPSDPGPPPCSPPEPVRLPPLP